jgi:hypothetical protein
MISSSNITASVRRGCAAGIRARTWSSPGEAAREFLRWPEYRAGDGGVRLDPAALEPHRRDFVVWLRDLLAP